MSFIARCLLGLILLLLLTASRASSQPTSVCLTVRQAAKINDSLRVLPFLRRENDTLRVAMGQYRHSADSATAAAQHHERAYLGKSLAYEVQSELLASAKLDTDHWRSLARRRGFVNWLFTTATAGVGYYFISKQFKP